MLAFEILAAEAAEDSETPGRGAYISDLTTNCLFKKVIQRNSNLSSAGKDSN
jgi:hypothetical protein